MLLRIYSFPDYAWECLLPDKASLDRVEPQPRLYGFPGSYWERSNKAWERVNGAVLSVQAPGISSFCIKRIAKSQPNH
ncbi:MULTISPECIES: hypothetical protein [unclassified Microcoleus]|uniref:hypothetical protein n=1 Tax=unclassified Microcoleus TaxID=2642155 RepID=UPI002FD5134C